MKRLRIGKRFIGEGEKLCFVADIGANHDGDIQRALKLIELAKEAGADAAKFQNFVASKIVSRKGFNSLGKQLSHQSGWKKPVFEVYEDASVSYEWTRKLKEKCDEIGIEYFTTPYDFETADHVDRYVNVYKIGSGDITWLENIEHIARKGKPVLIATGASTMSDVIRAMNVLQAWTDDIVLMQCNTNYTGSAENFQYVNLRVIATYAQRFPGVILGLSDHTVGHSTVLGAIPLGARVFEKHFTDDNSREGPDHKFAMNPKTWKEMVACANELDQALGDGIKRIEKNEADTVSIQRRGLRFTRDLPAGHELRKEDLFPLRPIQVEGFAPFELPIVLGRRLRHNVSADDYLRKGDIE